MLRIPLGSGLDSGFSSVKPASQRRTLYWAQPCSKNHKAFIINGSLSKSLISVLLIKNPDNKPLKARAQYLCNKAT
jgi:hypothetical protein